MYLYSSLPLFLLVLSLLIFPINTFVTLFLPSFWDGFPNFLPHIPNFNFCRPQIWRYGLWFCSGCYGNIGLWSGPGPDQLHFCQLYGCLQLHQEQNRPPSWPCLTRRGRQGTTECPVPTATGSCWPPLWPDTLNLSTSKASFYMCKVTLNKLR